VSSDKGKSSGISFTGLLTIVFIVLKLTSVIDWSWWWVVSPLWIAGLLWLRVPRAAGVILTPFGGTFISSGVPRAAGVILWSLEPGGRGSKTRYCDRGQSDVSADDGPLDGGIRISVRRSYGTHGRKT
jgi:hypothetical protein